MTSRTAPHSPRSLSARALALSALVAGLVWAGCSGLALAQQHTDKPVGYVKNVKGTASVTTLGKQVPAEPGTPLHQGSELRTDADSSMGVVFKDNTLMSFGPSTVLTVDEYLYEPAEGKLKLGARMGKGTLNYVSGVIAKLQPEAVTVKTPTGMIGVRGTQFLLKVDEE
ncbi:FecR family protein [Hydrogenophaga palleronii]|uniref:FecR family protein n=1 Tax=Hydrogenophaga palleronii TaxID=65655 RepID=UPI0008243793|nr:FecR domain-containing protein [Hydrogenophaga palleronii]